MLLAWVSPPVAVVEVYHYSHAVVLCALCHRQNVVLAAESATRVHPYTQTDGVEA